MRDLVNNELPMQLDSLQTTLARTQTIDEATRQQLISLLPEITRLLGQTTTSADVHPLTAPLETLAVRFEAEHPALGSALRQVIDALGKAGI
jgi:hypothetical protein